VPSISSDTVSVFMLFSSQVCGVGFGLLSVVTRAGRSQAVGIVPRQVVNL